MTETEKMSPLRKKLMEKVAAFRANASPETLEFLSKGAVGLQEKADALAEATDATRFVPINLDEITMVPPEDRFKVTDIYEEPEVIVT